MLNIIPVPLKAEEKEGFAPFGGKLKIYGEFSDTVKFAEKILINAKGGEGCELVFEKNTDAAEEGYFLKVEEKTIKVKASSEKGAFYALMTLLQLAGNAGRVPCCEIGDKPRFAYRGFMLDSARHFWSIDTVKRYIDLMARLKMNEFHFHLTDDQGWRVEIKKYPLLTEKGSIRKNTQLSLYGYNSGKEAHDDVEYGRGCFYTQEQLKDIVAYAAERHIEVIPEIDMPGHMVAAIACYPELSCTGEPAEVSTRWGVMDNICCCGKEDVYRFAKDVIDELCEIFPGRFFHIGGDEVPKKRWKTCPKCQEKIKKEGLKDENALQGYFNSEIAKYLKSKGKRMSGWNEILDAQDIMDTEIVAQWWVNHSAGNAQEKKWIKRGGKIIMSPVNYVYMDHPYHLRPLKKTYATDTELLGADFEKGVLGMEIPQWTEYIRCEKKLDMLTVPRLITFSEVCWSDRANKDYGEFEKRLENSREYFASLNCPICPKYLYTGKVRPWYAFTDGLKWALWYKNVNYEWELMKDRL